MFLGGLCMFNKKLATIIILGLITSSAVAMKRPSQGEINDGNRSEKRPRLNGQDEVAYIPDPCVFTVIEEKDFDTYKRLMVAGTNPNQVNPADGNPLSLTAWLNFTPKQNKEMYPVLKANGLDVNAATANTQATLLHFIALEKNVPFATQFATQLLEDGAKVNRKDFDGETPLFYANSPEMINLLAQRGARVNHQNYKDQTPLYGVAGVEKCDSARALVLSGANPAITDYRGETAYDRQERKFGNANPAIKNDESARKILVPAFVKQQGNPVLFVHDRAISGKPMTWLQLAKK